MERMELEVYSQASNAGIIKMPGRAFPGCVIQGDTLSTWLASAETIIDQLASSSNLDEAADEAILLAGQISAQLKHYESVLADHQLDLPYSRKLS
jgi:hypothetical protein